MSAKPKSFLYPSAMCQLLGALVLLAGLTASQAATPAASTSVAASGTNIASKPAPAPAKPAAVKPAPVVSTQASKTKAPVASVHKVTVAKAPAKALVALPPFRPATTGAAAGGKSSVIAPPANAGQP